MARTIGFRAAIARHSVDETLVDLQTMNSEPPQIIQRRVAGAEIIDGNLHATADQTINQSFGCQ